MLCCSAVIQPPLRSRLFTPTFRISTLTLLKHTPCRSASLSSAIGRGIRKAQSDRTQPKRTKHNEDIGRYAATGKLRDKRSLPGIETKKATTKRSESARKYDRQTGNSRLNPNMGGRRQNLNHPYQDAYNDRPCGNRSRIKENITQSQKRIDDVYQAAFDDRPSGKRNRREESATPLQKRIESSREEFQPRSESRPRSAAAVPLAVPYTTPASEFLYGRYAVEAALKSGRRKLYRLYVMEKPDESKFADDQHILKLALTANVAVKRVGEDWDKLLNKMSDRRPHNGYVMEASPLPQSPVVSLGASSRNKFSFVFDHQSSEEESVNGTDNQVTTISRGTRYPLLLMLDRILDPGNLGAIIRTATYFGVDGIVMLHHGTAPLSATTLKASAGSAEYMRLFKTHNGVRFIKGSQAKGWRFYAAVVPDSISKTSAGGQRSKNILPVESALKEHPCVLILGEEGSGLQPRHQNQADGTVSIERFGRAEAGIESLNVSIAAALLCDRFIRGAANSEVTAKAAKSDRLF